MGMALSPDGRCKTFDESANGFTRADGAGALVLELQSEAQKAAKTLLEEGWGWVGWVGLAVRYRFWAGWVGEKRWWEVGNWFWGWWAQIFFGDEMVVTLETEKSMRLLVREIVPVMVRGIPGFMRFPNLETVPIESNCSNEKTPRCNGCICFQVSGVIP